MKKKTAFLLALFLFSTCVFSASFDCQKASTFIEKEICSNQSLSKSDELLDKTYKLALSKSKNKKGLAKSQLSWLKNTRSQCDTIDCLEAVYSDRIVALKTDEVIQNKFEAYATDNCHAGTCWNDWIKEKEIIKKLNHVELVKLITVRKLSGEEHSDIEWETDEYFAFCTEKLPVIIQCNQKQKDCLAIIIPAGADAIVIQERAAFYDYACPTIDPALDEIKEIQLKNLFDIFEYYRKLK